MLVLQSIDLARWKTKLNDKAFEKLERFINQLNKTNDSPYDVIHGDDITSYVATMTLS